MPHVENQTAALHCAESSRHARGSDTFGVIASTCFAHMLVGVRAIVALLHAERTGRSPAFEKLNAPL